MHSFEQVTFSEVTEPERLLALTRRALAEASQPKVSYEVDVAALDGDDAGLGGTVAVIDTSRDPERRLPPASCGACAPSASRWWHG